MPTETYLRPEVAVPLSEAEIEQWNEEFPNITPAERIEQSYQRLGKRLVAASSFGPTSPVLLESLREVAPDTTVVHVRTHHENLATLEFANRYIEASGLDVHIEDAPVLRVPPAGSPGFEAFQRQVKVEPFQKALKELRALAFLSGRMRWQSDSRRDLPFVHQNGAVTVVNPIADVSLQDAEEFLADFYAETGLSRDENYFDPTKGESQRLECGLNITPYEIGRLACQKI